MVTFFWSIFTLNFHSFDRESLTKSLCLHRFPINALSTVTYLNNCRRWVKQSSDHSSVRTFSRLTVSFNFFCVRHFFCVRSFLCPALFWVPPFFVSDPILCPTIFVSDHFCVRPFLCPTILAGFPIFTGSGSRLQFFWGLTISRDTGHGSRLCEQVKSASRLSAPTDQKIG